MVDTLYIPIFPFVLFEGKTSGLNGYRLLFHLLSNEYTEIKLDTFIVSFIPKYFRVFWKCHKNNVIILTADCYNEQTLKIEM